MSLTLLSLSSLAHADLRQQMGFGKTGNIRFANQSPTLRAQELNQILNYVMGRNDVFQGYVYLNDRQAGRFQLKIFNRRSGRVRYVFVNARTKQIMR